MASERESSGVSTSLAASLRERFGERARFAEPLSRHTSFRIGGPADVWLDVETVDELSTVIGIVARAGAPLFLLGSGTNVLVSDLGVRGIVTRLGRGFATIEWSGAEVRAGAATPMKKLVYDAVERGFEGLEFGEGIPGSVGGGLTMNAGAFGGAIGKVVELLEGVERDGTVASLAKGDLDFRYRRLDLPAGFVITAVRLRLVPGDREAMEARVRSARDKRKRGQPLGFPNAGSIFKNPPGGFAGRLLEAAGVKGLKHGGAAVSERHANFIVNGGGASAADVRALMVVMRDRVEAETGIRLEPEVKLVGEW